MGTKFLIGTLMGVFFVLPAFSSEYNNSYQYQRRIPLQEEFGDYMSTLREKIQKNWIPPDVLEEGHAVVVFKVDRDGNIVSSYVKESSGNTLYDESAMDSIKKSSPYNSFPEGASRDVITIQYSFDSSIVSKESVKQIIEQAERYSRSNPQIALKYIDEAISSIQGDPSSYFLYARRSKIDKALGNEEQAKRDMQECERLRILYNKQRIDKCKQALLAEETPFGYFTLANAYDLAGDYQNAIFNINKAISMTELNHAYKRYRAEIIMRKDQETVIK